MLHAINYFWERRKKLLVPLFLVGMVIFLTACSTKPITSSSTNFGIAILFIIFHC